MGVYLSRPRLVKIRSHTTRYRLRWHSRVMFCLCNILSNQTCTCTLIAGRSRRETRCCVCQRGALRSTPSSLLYCVHLHYEFGVTDMVGLHTCPRVCFVRHPVTHLPRTTTAWAPHGLSGIRWMSVECDTRDHTRPATTLVVPVCLSTWHDYAVQPTTFGCLALVHVDLDHADPVRLR